jgi:hypothetical protein
MLQAKLKVAVSQSSEATMFSTSMPTSYPSSTAEQVLPNAKGKSRTAATIAIANCFFEIFLKFRTMPFSLVSVGIYVFRQCRLQRESLAFIASKSSLNYRWMRVSQKFYKACSMIRYVCGFLGKR